MSRFSARRLRRRVNRRLYRLLFRAYRRLFPTPKWTGPLDGPSLRRILVVRDDRVGDMVLTTPLFAFFQQAAPQAEIDVLASRANAPLLAGDQRIATVFVNDRTWRWWATTAPRIRARRYDLIINPIARYPYRQGVVMSLLATRDTYKVSGWRPVRFQGLFTKAFRIPPRLTHMAESVLAIGQLALGQREIGRQALECYPLSLAPNVEADARIAQFLAAYRLERFVIVNISAATDPEREWSPERAAAVVRRLLERHEGFSVVITPAPEKEGRATEVAQLCDNLRIIVGPVFPLRDLVALVRRALLVVSPSTALVHFASATGRPVVALYAPQHPNDLLLWLPLGVPHRTVVSELGDVMDDIPPEAISGAFDELMREIERPGVVETTPA
jgi:ADP-heptose:LPS heptosyltransferase